MEAPRSSRATRPGATTSSSMSTLMARPGRGSGRPIRPAGQRSRAPSSRIGGAKPRWLSERARRARLLARLVVPLRLHQFLLVLRGKLRPVDCEGQLVELSGEPEGYLV